MYSNRNESFLENVSTPQWSTYTVQPRAIAVAQYSGFTNTFYSKAFHSILLVSDCRQLCSFFVGQSVLSMKSVLHHNGWAKRATSLTMTCKRFDEPSQKLPYQSVIATETASRGAERIAWQ